MIALTGETVGWLVVTGWVLSLVVVCLFMRSGDVEPPSPPNDTTIRRLRHVDAVYDELSEWENEVLDAAHEARDEGAGRTALTLNTLSYDISKCRQLLTVLRDRIEQS